MGETNAVQKGTHFFKSLKGEFKKIIWPKFPLLMKQTWTVIFVTAIVGGIVAFIDWIYLFGTQLLVK
ncbi:MAG: preprotein translocase subunit SecE [Vallitaleaceae bacterium]|nr:preprotein translocase subunit SecE [Vallitaleaceae bacterium]